MVETARGLQTGLFKDIGCQWLPVFELARETCLYCTAALPHQVPTVSPNVPSARKAL